MGNVKTSKTNTENNNSKLFKIIAGVVLGILIVVVILFVLFNREVQYSVTFDTNGGSSVESMVITENELLVKPKDPVREGYTFVGWYYDDELWDFTKPVTKDLVLEARWAKKSNGNGIELNKTNLTLKVNAKEKLVVTFLSDDVSSNDLIWTSSNKSVVSVDNLGNLTALKEGYAVIKVTTKDGKYTASVSVRVEAKEVAEVKVTGVTLDKTNLELTVNETSLLKATVKPTNATNKSVTWKSSNTNVVVVDVNGKVTAKAAGTATITVTTKDGKYTAKATVTVTKKTEVVEEEKDVLVTGVTLDKTEVSLNVNGAITLIATVKPSNATNKDVIWKSSDNEVVVVDANGKVTAKAAGTATITVTTKDGNFTAKAVVTVSDNYVVTVTPYVQETGSIFQYPISVTKNGTTFGDYTVVDFGNFFVRKDKYISESNYNKNIKTAEVVFTNGNRVEAQVVYK